MPRLEYPTITATRGPLFWLRPRNLWATRRKLLRSDHSVAWRDGLDATRGDRSRVVSFDELTGKTDADSFRFLILADTGEGDRSQYALLPLIRALAPDFMIINGDVAYPAGSIEDFDYGFFQPYRDLGIPIWAVPGNHEYYSQNSGREFHDVFCTEKHRRRWEEAGLPFVRQPGTYWELRHERADRPLVVIGLDTLQKANLDGRGFRKRVDHRQLEWFRARLDDAEERKKSVVVLFHIPALMNEELASGVHLRRLHAIIARHSCVKLVVCGHEHNYQSYTPETFAAFIEDYVPESIPVIARPHYVVCGGGGAFLGCTNFDPGAYPSAETYPTADQWEQYATAGRRLLDRVGLGRRTLARLTMLGGGSAHADGDTPRHLSFLMIEVARRTSTMTPVFLGDLQKLYAHLPASVAVNVQNPAQDPHAGEVESCVQRDRAVRLS